MSDLFNYRTASEQWAAAHAQEVADLRATIARLETQLVEKHEAGWRALSQSMGDTVDFVAENERLTAQLTDERNASRIADANLTGEIAEQEQETRHYRDMVLRLEQELREAKAAVAEARQWEVVPEGEYDFSGCDDPDDCDVWWTWEISEYGLKITDVVGDWVDADWPDGWRICRRVTSDGGA